jgi:hypothetical protein
VRHANAAVRCAARANLIFKFHTLVSDPAKIIKPGANIRGSRCDLALLLGSFSHLSAGPILKFQGARASRDVTCARKINMVVPMNMRLLGVLITCVSQFSEPLRPNNAEAIRIFGNIEIGKTMFCDSDIRNPVLNSALKKHYNMCDLGNSDTVDGAEEHECRKMFFRGDWM